MILGGVSYGKHIYLKKSSMYLRFLYFLVSTSSMYKSKLPKLNSRIYNIKYIVKWIQYYLLSFIYYNIWRLYLPISLTII